MTFEEMLIELQAENLSLENVHASQNKAVQTALKSKEIQASLARFEQIRAYLAPYQITCISTLEQALQVADLLKQSQFLGLDIETSKTCEHGQAGLNPKVSRIRLIQLFDGKLIYLFDLFKIGSLEWMHTLQHQHLIAHNATFEAAHFHYADVVFSKLDCTMLMGRVFLNRNLSLKDAAQDAFDLDMDKHLQVSNWGRENLLPEQLQYAALDAVIAYQLYQKYLAWFEQHPHYQTTYEFLQALIYPLVRQQAHGIKVDVAEHQNIIFQWEQRIAECKNELAADGLLDAQSHSAVQAYLHQKLTDEEIEVWEKTKSGRLSTNKDALSRLTHHKTLGALAELTTLRTRLANFGAKLQDLLIHGELYPSYQIAGMVSGRFGCSKPNIQNQPRSGFKHIYIAPEGWQFVTGDLSQVELRVAGLISEDAVINEAYAQGKDLHRMMAAKMTGKAESEITKAERTAAKGVNFGLLFGGGAKGLKEYVRASYGVEMSLEEAENAKATFHATYKQFTFWQNAIVKHTNQYDESESIYCRLTRHYDHTDHFKDGAYKDIYTHAMNYPIQSTAWELLALAIRHVDANLPEDGSIRISHHVYDELCLCAKDEQVLTAAKLLRQAFEVAYLTVFPDCNLNGIIEVGAGKNWAIAGSDEAVIAI